MSLPLPRLDDRSFDDLVDEARSLIRTHQPEWTNHNPSDPGITLLELFAWVAEMLIFRADQVPDRHRLVFLTLLNGPDWRLPADSTVEDEIARTLTGLRARFRAVTVADHEALALEASPQVARALCLARRDLGSMDEATRLAPRAGYVSIVVLPVAGTSDADAAALRDAVRAYLEPRRLLTTQYVVSEPIWSPITAEVRVAKRPDVLAERAAAAVADAITQFLDPLRGGEDATGWPFGRDVYVSDLYRLLEALPEVDYVPDIALASSADPAEPRSVAARGLWNPQGDAIGLQLAPHVLPRVTPAAIDVVAADAFVSLQATITVTPATAVVPGPAAQAAKEALRRLFDPRHGGPTGTSAWSTTPAALRSRLLDELGELARDVQVIVRGDRQHVSTDARDQTTVRLDEHELADIQTEVVIAP